MSSYMKRTDVLQRLKTRELIYQDISGVYPVQGAVGYFVDASGTFGTSTVTIDGSGNMIVSGDLDVIGTATLGDLYTLAQNVHIGLRAGVSQGSYSVAIGYFAGNTSQGNNAVAIGQSAGQVGQGTDAVAVGVRAGNQTQGAESIAIGKQAGESNQGMNSIAIGNNAGATGQNNYSIAIGYQAGAVGQGANSIVLNASGVAFTGTTGGFFVNPVATRASTTGASALYIDNVTGEIFRSP